MAQNGSTLATTGHNGELVVIVQSTHIDLTAHPDEPHGFVDPELIEELSR